MKKGVLEFLRRGLVAAGIGPTVLVILYLLLWRIEDLQILQVGEVCTAIVSLMALAFIAGGVNVVYGIERLPLLTAILIHGAVLYVGYLVTYLINGWLEWGRIPVLVFSVIFVFGYLLIWAIIYFATKRRTKGLNDILKKKQEDEARSAPRDRA